LVSICVGTIGRWSRQQSWPGQERKKGGIAAAGERGCRRVAGRLELLRL